MRYVTEYPRTVRVMETVWITMSDGCRLAARIWLPEDADAAPVPAIFEHLPYRLNDGTAVRDSRHYPYLAGHGYACVRTDQRGTGESDGVLMDEYLPQEQLDACEVIAWIAEQPWCTGAVGMTGISWSGFNSLQVAARRPPALKAIITLCSTDDRYADDVTTTVAASPRRCSSGRARCSSGTAVRPIPALVGERWRSMWLERMETRAALHRGMARPPASRRLLEAGLGVRGLRGDRGRGVRGGRLVGRLHECDSASAGGPAGAA